MSFQDTPDTIGWRLHLNSAPSSVFDLLSTDQGRARFWAESAAEEEGHILFIFPNGWEWRGKILESVPPTRFSLIYFGSETSFELEDDGLGGTVLTLIDRGVPEEDRVEVIAGWVSVLMALKAAADYNVDLRNHDPERTWEQGYCNN